MCHPEGMRARRTRVASLIAGLLVVAVALALGGLAGAQRGSRAKAAPRSAHAATRRWIPPRHLTWYWQLQGTIKNTEPVAAFDIDGFDNSAAEVTKLHSEGKHVICYVDAGTYEPDRTDSKRFPASVLGKAVEGWPGERWLDIRKLSMLEPIMTSRFQMCKQKGFDAVEPDNIDGYENGSGFPLTAQQQLTYDEWVAAEAHALGMAVLQKNDGEQTAQLQSHFDGALTEQCNQYGECTSYHAYLSAGKPVLDAEYELRTSSFCAADNKVGIMGARFDLDLTGTTFDRLWYAVSRFCVQTPERKMGHPAHWVSGPKRRHSMQHGGKQSRGAGISTVRRGSLDGRDTTTPGRARPVPAHGRIRRSVLLGGHARHERA
jgi:hypothetical protein